MDIIKRAYTVAADILGRNRAKLTQIAEHLIANETIEGDELEKLFNEPVPSPSLETVPVS